MNSLHCAEELIDDNQSVKKKTARMRMHALVSVCALASIVHLPRCAVPEGRPQTEPCGCAPEGPATRQREQLQTRNAQLSKAHAGAVSTGASTPQWGERSLRALPS